MDTTKVIKYETILRSKNDFATENTPYFGVTHTKQYGFMIQKYSLSFTNLRTTGRPFKNSETILKKRLSFLTKPIFEATALWMVLN